MSDTKLATTISELFTSTCDMLVSFFSKYSDGSEPSPYVHVFELLQKSTLLNDCESVKILDELTEEKQSYIYKLCIAANPMKIHSYSNDYKFEEKELEIYIMNLFANVYCVWRDSHKHELYVCARDEGMRYFNNLIVNYGVKETKFRLHSRFTKYRLFVEDYILNNSERRSSFMQYLNNRHCTFVVAIHEAKQEKIRLQMLEQTRQTMMKAEIYGRKSLIQRIISIFV